MLTVQYVRLQVITNEPKKFIKIGSEPRGKIFACRSKFFPSGVASITKVENMKTTGLLTLKVYSILIYNNI